MSTIVTKASKGSILTSVEMDANLDNLNADKIESNTAVTVVGDIAAYSTAGGRQIKVATAADIVGAIGATAVTNATNVTGTIASGVTATTQTAGDNSTKVATTAYVKTATDASGVQIQTIYASIAVKAIIVTLPALSLDFRDTTLTTGTVTRVSGTPAALVIAATDSFGLVTAAGNQRIAILAINNAGTIELAASALAGGESLDETGVINTATAATLGTHIKAANVRTGVAYRVIGFVDATFTTATGWGSLALVQGTGGQALAAMSSLGYGQTWQNMTGSRVAGTTYYNTTGKPIQVSVYSPSPTDSVTMVELTIQGILIGRGGYGRAGVGDNGADSVSGIVPPGGSYMSTGFTAFLELR